MVKKTQTELVFEYMQANGSITSLQAFNDLGVTRISARIYDLRQEGHLIESDFITVPRRNGETTTVKKYTLVITEPQTKLNL